MTRNWYSLWFRAFALCSTAITVFWPTLQQMESVWRHSETYMHAYFILPMTLYMVWVKRENLQGMTPQPALLPALLILPVSLLWLSAYAIDVGFVSHISQIVVIQLIIWHLLGNEISAKIRFPLCFLIFLAPFGESLTPALQQITADIGVALLRFADVPVYREGLYLHTPVTVFEVADACSGLSFFISSAVLSSLFAYLYFRSIHKQIIYVLFVLGLAILGNGLRAFLLMLIGEKTNMAWGFGADHYYYGWAVFGVTMLVSYHVGDRFSDTESQLQHSRSQQQLNLRDLQHSRVTTNSRLSWVAACILIAFYPIRMTLTTTQLPANRVAVFEIAGFSKQQNEALETTFHDGVRRSALQNSFGIEIFAADYAVRQISGDLITWHNKLFNEQKWTTTVQENIGTYFDGSEFIQLTNVRGTKYTLQYWYQIGNTRTTSKGLIKLLQLKAILLGEPVVLSVRMISTPDNDFAKGKQIIKDALENIPQVKLPGQPYYE